MDVCQKRNSSDFSSGINVRLRLFNHSVRNRFRCVLETLCVLIIKILFENGSETRDANGLFTFVLKLPLSLPRKFVLMVLVP